MKLKNAILSLQFVFRPSYWIMTDKYSHDWDKLLNELLDAYPVVLTERNYIVLGEIQVSVYPEAPRLTGIYCFEGLLHGYRPSRLTIKRLIKMYLKAVEDRDYVFPWHPGSGKD